MSKLEQLAIDYDDKKQNKEPWEYVDMPPLIPTVPAGPTAEEWRRLDEPAKQRLIAERRVLGL